MPRPRKSIAQARLTGAYAINPGRYNSRVEPLVRDPLGDPPEWLAAGASEAWLEFGQRLPWLNKSHRGITAIACLLQAKLAAGTLGIPGMQLLRVTLGQLGATPADAHRVAMPSDEDDEEDPAEAYFR